MLLKSKDITPHKMFCFLVYSVHIFIFVLFCTLCRYSFALSDLSFTSSTTNDENKIDIFKLNGVITAQKPKPEDGQIKNEEITPKDFYSPFIFVADDVIMTVAGVNSKEPVNDKAIDILVKHIIKENNWFDTVKKETNKWTTQFAVRNFLNNENNILKSFAVAVKEKKEIYLILLSVKNQNRDSLSSEDLKFYIAGGTIDDTDKKKITWETTKELKSDKIQSFVEHINKEKLKIEAFSGFAIVTEMKEIIFLLKTQTTDKKTVFALIYSEAANKIEELQFLSINDVTQNCQPYIFLWEKRITLLFTQCTDTSNNLQLKELNFENAEKTLVNSDRPLSRFARFFKDKSDFTTANIKNNDVLLFTQKEEKQPSDSDKKYNFYLWATDGSRLHNAGMFLTNVNVIISNLLYTNDELFALYQNWEGSQPKDVFLTHIKAQLNNLTSVITAWRETNKVVKQLCGDKKVCTNELSTDGLVGYLSSRGNSNTWNDEYLFVDATINDGTKVSNSFTFNTAGAGAQWSVSKENKYNLYNFTDLGFSLVAFVTIESVPEGDIHNSVLGVSVNNNKQKSVSLWCMKNEKWAISDGEKKVFIETSVNCLQKNMYMVTMSLDNGDVKIYINGELLNDVNKDENKIKEIDVISHFYFGVDKTDTSQNNMKSHVTVQNVLLYNRPLKYEEEIKNLKVIKVSNPIETSTGTNVPNASEESNTEEDNIYNDGRGSEEKTTELLPTGDVVQSSTLQRESAVSVCVNLWNVLYLLIVCCGGCKVCCC